MLDVVEFFLKSILFLSALGIFILIPCSFGGMMYDFLRPYCRLIRKIIISRRFGHKISRFFSLCSYYLSLLIFGLLLVYFVYYLFVGKVGLIILDLDIF